MKDHKDTTTTAEDRVDLKELVMRDYLRLKSRGRWPLVITVVMSIVQLYLAEWFGREYWPAILEYMEKNEYNEWWFCFCLGHAVSIPTLIGTNVIFMLIYKA